MPRADDRTHGVVLTSGTARMFCGGFDVQEVFGYAPDKLKRYIARFIRLFDTLRHLPKPTVAGLNGHCYAGGSILALACDERIMAEGDFQFALNEVTLGVVLPARIVQAMAAVVPGPTARQMFLEGHAWRAQDAQQHGIVDELVPLGNVRHRALTMTRQLASRAAAVRSLRTSSPSSRPAAAQPTRPRRSRRWPRSSPPCGSTRNASATATCWCRDCRRSDGRAPPRLGSALRYGSPRDGLPMTPEAQGHLTPDDGFVQHAQQHVHARDRLVVHREQHVARAQPRHVRGPTPIDVHHAHTRQLVVEGARQ